MQVSIRSATLDDVPTIMWICRDPLVAPNQYRVGLSAELGFRAIVAGEMAMGRYERRISSIDVDGDMVGYIHHDHHFSRGAENVTLGWNLAPKHWGRGIMPAAVQQLMAWCVAKRRTQLFVAECFRENARCIRVMEKIGFLPAPISSFDRFVTALSNGSWKWVLRFEKDLRQRQAALRVASRLTDQENSQA